MILGLKGPAWWHVSGVGKFFNSIHLWAVEVFFFTMVVHLWGKFFMGAWRGGRAWTWVTGAVIFLVAIGTAFTGYLSQQNFDSQWIASEGKDGLNSVGIGAFFNVIDFGQMYTWHVILLPVAVVALVAWHVLLVRTHGVVPPYAGEGRSCRSPAKGCGMSRPATRLPPRSSPRSGTGRTSATTWSRSSSSRWWWSLRWSVVLAILFSSPDDRPDDDPAVGAHRSRRTSSPPR